MEKQKIKFKQTEIGKIPEDWDIKKIGDLFQVFAGGDLSKLSFSKNKSHEYKYPIYSNSLINKGLYGFSKKYQYEPECMTITGRGEVGRAECRKEPFNAIVRLLVLKPKKEVSCYFAASFINSRLDFSHVGSAVNQLTAPTISEFSIAFPPLSEQRAIAKILSDLDAKIELNNKMNKTLEAIGQALFKKWFLENPQRENWEIKKLPEIAEIIYGYPFNSKLFNNKEGFPLIRIRDLTSNNFDIKTTEKFDKKFVISKGNIITGMDGEFDTVIWKGEKVLQNQRICKFNSKTEGISEGFIYYWVKDRIKEIEFGKVGTTVIHLSKADLDDLDILIPEKEILQKFNKIINGMINQQIVNTQENIRLEKIRDALLPKLMSGEIRVK